MRAAALVLLLGLSGAAPTGPGWDEIAWPFPRDAWPAGRAFRCRDCDLVVSVRPKLGFCNCSTGVSGDAEVDAVSDVDMISAEFASPAPGRAVEVDGLRGRVRAYSLPGGETAAGYALSSRCDLLVAAARGRDAGDVARIQGLLGSDDVAGWIASALGRR